MTLTLSGLIVLLVIAAICGGVGKALAGGGQGAVWHATTGKIVSTSRPAVAGEALSNWGAGAALSKVPNIGFTTASAAIAVIDTPTSSTLIAQSTSTTVVFPTRAPAQAAAKTLGNFGLFVKIPWDLSGAAFSALACSIY